MINKIDLVPEEERTQRIKALVKAYGSKEPHFVIAGISGEGCRELIYAIMDHVEKTRDAAEDLE